MYEKWYRTGAWLTRSKDRQVSIALYSALHNYGQSLQQSHENILSSQGLNSLTFSDPYAKLCFTAMIVRSLAEHPRQSGDGEQKRIIYIDTDTTFTAYLLAGFILKREFNLETRYAPQKSHHKDNEPSSRQQSYRINNENFSKKSNLENESYKDCVVNNKIIQVFLPSEGNFESTLGDVISSIQEASIVIFDSLNSFYNLYPLAYPETPRRERRDERFKEPRKAELIVDLPLEEKRNSDNSDLESLEDHKRRKTAYTVGRLDHLLSIYVMLLVKHGLTVRIPVLVTSMARYKKMSEGIWVKAPACRRLLDQKSIVKMSVDMRSENDISVNLLRHPSLVQQTIVYPNTGLYSAFKVNQGKSKH